MNRWSERHRSVATASIPWEAGLFERRGRTLLKMGYYSAPPPLACRGRGCYSTPRGVIEYYLGVIEYYLGAADV